MVDRTKLFSALAASVVGGTALSVVSIGGKIVEEFLVAGLSFESAFGLLTARFAPYLGFALLGLLSSIVAFLYFRRATVKADSARDKTRRLS